jgi:hypothetical protein
VNSAIKILGKIVVAAALAVPLRSPALNITTALCTVQSGACATGIAGWDIGGHPYNVALVLNGTYNSIYSSSPSPYMGDKAAAVAASGAMLELFANAGLSGIPSDAITTDYFFIPFSIERPNDPYPEAVDTAYSAHVNGRGWIGPLVRQATTTANYSSNLPTYSFSWAVFAPVPEPAGALTMIT